MKNKLKGYKVKKTKKVVSFIPIETNPDPWGYFPQLNIERKLYDAIIKQLKEELKNDLNKQT